jgi:hypothetical protein
MNVKKRKLFIDRLNHSWPNIFEMKYLKKITNEDDYKNKIIELLGINKNELCYIISMDSNDDKFVIFSEAINIIYGNGSGSLIINSNATKLFLETEQTQGPPERFIGKNELKYI